MSYINFAYITIFNGALRHGSMEQERSGTGRTSDKVSFHFFMVLFTCPSYVSIGNCGLLPSIVISRTLYLSWQPGTTQWTRAHLFGIPPLRTALRPVFVFLVLPLTSHIHFLPKIHAAPVSPGLCSWLELPRSWMTGFFASMLQVRPVLGTLTCKQKKRLDCQTMKD